MGVSEVSLVGGWKTEVDMSESRDTPGAERERGRERGYVCVKCSMRTVYTYNMRE